MLRGGFLGYYVLHSFTAIPRYSFRHIVFSSLDRNYLGEIEHGTMAVEQH